MRHKTLCLALLLFFISGCASKPAVPSGESPSGRWSGDYGVDSDRRDPITVDLRWENANLTGVVRAGPRDIPLTKATYVPETRAITMEFDAQGNGGQIVHYVIEGKVSGDSIAGTWSHDNLHGDFRVTRS